MAMTKGLLFNQQKKPIYVRFSLYIPTLVQILEISVIYANWT